MCYHFQSVINSLESQSIIILSLQRIQTSPFIQFSQKRGKFDSELTLELRVVRTELYLFIFERHTKPAELYYEKVIKFQSNRLIVFFALIINF